MFRLTQILLQPCKWRSTVVTLNLIEISHHVSLFKKRRIKKFIVEIISIEIVFRLHYLIFLSENTVVQFRHKSRTAEIP